MENQTTETTKRWPREGKSYALKSSAKRAAQQDGLVEGQFEVHAQGKGKDEKFFYKVTEAHKSVAAQMPEEKKAELAAKKEAQEAAAAEVKGETSKVEEAPRVVTEQPPTFDKATCIHCDLVFKTTASGTAQQNLEKHIEAKHLGAADAPRRELKIVDMTDPVQAEQHKAEEAPPPIAPGLPPVAEKPEAEKPLQRTVSATAPRGAPVTKVPKWAEGANKSAIEGPTKRVWHIADEMRDAALAKGQPVPSRKTVIEECVRRGIAYYTARTQYQQWLTEKNKELRGNQK